PTFRGVGPALSKRLCAIFGDEKSLLLVDGRIPEAEERYFEVHHHPCPQLEIGRRVDALDAQAIIGSWHEERIFTNLHPDAVSLHDRVRECAKALAHRSVDGRGGRVRREEL